MDGDSTPRERDERGRHVRSVLLGVLTVIVVGFALRETASVTLPLAFAFFLAALVWPVTKWLAHHVPRGLAVAGGTLVFLTVAGGFFASLYGTAAALRDRSRGYEPELTAAIEDMQTWALDHGVPMDEVSGSSALAGLLQTSGRIGLEAVAGFVLVLAFMSLAMLEVKDAQEKVRSSTDARRAARILDVSERVSSQFRRYFLVRTVIGLITGVLCAGGAWMIGLELWWLWGLLNFLLNYIPTLGSFLGVLPPALFALVQFNGDWMMVLAAIGVVGGVQLVMGNWVDPLLQGKALSLSPLVVLFAVTFWGWVWGVAGALIGVPLTVLVALVCAESPRTRWIAVLLAGDPSEVKETASGANVLGQDAASRFPRHAE
ncbi:MAG: AI-2E family transporter [Sandaracinaceae bacterium]